MTRAAISPASEAARPRVLIVDDSAVARAVLSRIIADSRAFTVAAAVPDVDRALGVLAETAVDVILLDLEMPGVHGLTALPDLIAAGAGAKVLIVSSSANDGAAATVRALALGAADTLVKPGGAPLAGRFAEALLDRLARLTDGSEPSAAMTPVSTNATAPGTVDLIAIGASTGGIHALNGMLRALPRSLRCPIVITQHLPESFIPYFAAQIALVAGRPCEVAADRTGIRPGQILIAPGDAHLVGVALPNGQAAVRLSREPVDNGHMPSVDPMFATMAGVYGPRLLAVVLSGMGRDGLAGANVVHETGGTLIVQDRESSVVWGMPGAVAAAGLASAILEPAAIGQTIAERTA